MRRFFLVPLLMLGLTGMVYGQTDGDPPKEPSDSRISIDRNSFTVGMDTVEVGRYQLEMGYLFTDDNDIDPEFRSHTFPQMMFRTGLRDDLELRVSWDGYTFVHDGGDLASDMSLGFKWIVPLDDSCNLGILGEVSLPTGHGDSDYDPSLILIGDYYLNDLWSFTANLGIGAPTDEFTGDRFAQGTFSLMANRVVGDDLTLFTEYYTIFPEIDDGDCLHMLQGGLVYILNDDMAIDAFIGAGLNDDAPDFVAGVGFSYRF